MIRRNTWLFAGLAAITLGYVVLGAFENTVLSPILLVGGYCVLIPLHLWLRHRSDHSVGE